MQHTITITPKMAIDTLTEAFENDSCLAHSWHSNIAMACYDAIGDDMDHEDAHQAGNEAASRFMLAAFGVITGTVE